MMKKKSLGLNAALNGLRTAIDLLFPIITFPYISRVLNVDNLGTYNFASSIISYFLMIASLGITSYAIREGAKVREDPVAFDRFASEIFTINLASTVTAYALLGICMLLVPTLQAHMVILGILSIQIFFTTLGTDWVYSIFEEYAYITIRSISFKVLSLILLFTLVRSEADLLVYTGITVFAHVGSNVLNFVHARKFCRIRPVLGVPWKRHMGPIMVIFSTSVAITIYTCSDFTMLGLLRTEHEVGVYAVSAQIYSLAKTMLSAVIMVAVARLSLYLGQGRMDEYRQILSRVTEGVTTLMVPSVLMLLCLAEEFILAMADSTYLEAVTSLRLLAWALIVCLTGWIANDCVLIPARREKIVLMSTLVSAVLNILIDFLLIPSLGVDAVGWSTLAAEASVMIISVKYSADIAPVDRALLIDVMKTVLAAAIVPVICFQTRKLGYGPEATLAIAATGSVIAYAVLLLIVRTDLARESVAIIASRLRKKG